MLTAVSRVDCALCICVVTDWTVGDGTVGVAVFDGVSGVLGCDVAVVVSAEPEG